MTRAPVEILRGLQTLMAELTAALQEPDPKSDISPKLAQALNRETTDPAGQLARGGQHVSRETRATMPSTADVPLKSHDEIRQQARDYKPERPRDYVPGDYEGFDEAVFLGTGDRNEP